MDIYFRVDSSIPIGSGHLMRCLTLAHRLAARGCKVSFISRDHPLNMCSLVERDFAVYRLPRKENSSGDLAHSGWLGTDWETDAREAISVIGSGRRADLLVVDHYALDYRWEGRLRLHAGRIMVIDDLADRAHDCDILLDQNLCKNMEARYDGLVPPHCVRLLGPAYVLLRPEFIEARKTLRRRDGVVRRIMIFFGGSDQTNETSKALEAVKSLGRPDIAVDAVTGSSNIHGEQVRGLCESIPNCTWHFQVDNMAELMARADLAIGAGGTATWERCFMGLPAIIMTIAKNQEEPVAALTAAGAAFYLGEALSVSVDLLAGEIKNALADPGRIKEAAENSLRVMGDPEERKRDLLLRELMSMKNVKA